MIRENRIAAAGNVSDIISRAADILASEGLINVREIVERLASSSEITRGALGYLVQRGQAEVLRPYRGNDDMDYYRWKQPNDKDYLWQQEINKEDSMSAPRKSSVTSYLIRV